MVRDSIGLGARDSISILGLKGQVEGVACGTQREGAVWRAHVTEAVTFR